MEKKTQDKNLELVKRAAELAKVEKDLAIAKALLTKVRTKADKAEAKEAIEEKAKEFRKAKTSKKAAKKSVEKTPKKAEKKTVEVLPKEDQGAAVLELVEKGLEGVEFEVIGSWVWATGDTKPVKDSLKEVGFHFSAKKSAWYWKPTTDAPKRRARFNSVDTLKKHWAAA